MVGTPTLAQADAAVKESLAFIAFGSICSRAMRWTSFSSSLGRDQRLGHGLLRGSPER